MLNTGFTQYLVRTAILLALALPAASVPLAARTIDSTSAVAAASDSDTELAYVWRVCRTSRRTKDRRACRSSKGKAKLYVAELLQPGLPTGG